MGKLMPPAQPTVKPYRLIWKAHPTVKPYRSSGEVATGATHAHPTVKPYRLIWKAHVPGPAERRHPYLQSSTNKALCLV